MFSFCITDAFAQSFLIEGAPLSLTSGLRSEPQCHKH